MGPFVFVVAPNPPLDLVRVAQRSILVSDILNRLTRKQPLVRLVRLVVCSSIGPAIIGICLIRRFLRLRCTILLRLLGSGVRWDRGVRWAWQKYPLTNSELPCIVLVLVGSHTRVRAFKLKKLRRNLGG